MESKSTNGNNPKPAKRSFLDRFKRNTETADESSAEPEELPEPQSKISFGQRMRSALSRTGEGLGSLFLGTKVIDEALLEELETSLIMADVGIETTTKIIAELTKQLDRKSLKDGAALKDALHEILLKKLAVSEGEINFDGCEKPFVMFVVGVNGVGKTTTIGKLASRLKSQGKSIMLAAGDTFRAAAVEQLQVWGERNAVPVIAQHTGADSASVVFDGIQAAKSRGADVIIADTAGRLHNKSNLMEELKKVKRVASKIDEHAPHEILLVLDAGTGQNAVAQMSEFNQVVGVTGIALTKLDGTAKGGIIFALADKFSVPIRYIGVGEGLDDLQPFNASEFVQALLNVEG
ncbi:signal recognition particle-docking protein FtsY [Porticoccaceae bacterium]|jgi:fused signal recognition particle receptor|nr:signal recognition particle-docking protein FtsY [Porticoccaceae bacterium]MDB2395155.1 signal recognition particle-docking protein FtsY [Porticoccaceae bacterium]MDC0053318.1 signal recognition particle-docking protein FtsY [Gammaproteobacteria bacterium]